MTRDSAKVMLTVVRRSGDHLMVALNQLENELGPDEFERWKKAVGRSMGALYLELLEPICREHPEIVPKALGGNAAD